MPAVVRGLAVVACALAAQVAPRLAALALAAAGAAAMRLHPRKTLDIGWKDLLAALRACLLLPGGTWRADAPVERAAVEAAIEALWPPGLGDRSRGGAAASAAGASTAASGAATGAVVGLSVRTLVDLALANLALPKDSEVLFMPGITVPALVEVVESHGLRAVGAGPHTAAQLLPNRVEPHVTSATRVLVITHLFGSVNDVGGLIREARRLGLFVIEDVAQSYTSLTLPPGLQSGQRGFRGHADADLSVVSFGLLKTDSALGGAVGRVRDFRMREGMLTLQSTYPVRPSGQFLGVVLKAMCMKVIGQPHVFGMIAAASLALGVDYDVLLVKWSRGFPDGRGYRNRPSLPLLRLLLWRLKEQDVRRAHETLRVQSRQARQRQVGEALVSRLAAEGVQVLGNSGVFCSWWLVPIVDDDPRGLVRELSAQGFDATCSATQLRPIEALPAKVAGVAGGSSGAALGSAHNAPMAHELMRKVVYLPIYPDLPPQACNRLVAAVLEARRRRSQSLGAAPPPSGAGDAARARARRTFAQVALAAALGARPDIVLWGLPSPRTLLCAGVVALVAFTALAVVARRLAAEPRLRVSRALIAAMSPKARPEGVGFWRSQPAVDGRVDGALLLTGSTGFVGGATLFALLARSEELGISRIVLLIRKRSGSSVESRLAELRSSSAFEEVSEQFERLVVAIEGDVAVQEFGWSERLPNWPYREPLRAVVHCAGDVRFDQPLQAAALAIVSASLQVAQLAARWGAKRFVFVSTAFVHAVPSTVDALQEQLVELRDFDPMELYRDAVSHGGWAEKAMLELGFPNTYTFAKAIAEHLVLRACEADQLDGCVVRPSIVCPAWAAPCAGWAGAKPSTIVAAVALLASRGLRVFCNSRFPYPVVPVDFVAGAIVEAAAGASRAGDSQRISHAAVDASQADWMLSFSRSTEILYQVLALRGDISLPEAGLLLRVTRWSENRAAFRRLDFVVNRLPNLALSVLCTICDTLVRLFGLESVGWKDSCKKVQTLTKYSFLPMAYAPFSSPCSAWRFRSKLRLPEDWSGEEYMLMIIQAALDFVRGVSDRRSSRKAASAFAETRVVRPRPVLCDALLCFSVPGAPVYQCAAALVIRRALQCMDLRLTVDATSLVALTSLTAPLVLCPTHRSLLDFVLVGMTCFHMRPLVPELRMPHVAADAEFARLPGLGRVLTALGAFFVRRGGGAVQPDPALRAEVDRVLQRGRPLEVFLEGLRSRGRRHLRLRTGLLRAVRDVAQRNVALVPMAISYELLPEDQSFYDELQGLPREPLRTIGLFRWALRGLRGELAPYGDAHIRFGSAWVMDTSSDLMALLGGVQSELVALTTISTLHMHALAEVLELPGASVVKAARADGIPLRASRLESGPEGGPAFVDAQRWPLALQAAALFADRLPQQWASWLVEPAITRAGAAPGVEDLPDLDAALGSEIAATKPAAGCEGAAVDFTSVVAALAARFVAAEKTAIQVASLLHEGGLDHVTEEHLLQRLLRSQEGKVSLPPPLARGAAYIVTGKAAPGNAAGYDMPAPRPQGGAQPAAVAPLWPASHRQAAQRVDKEALDRWGFSDTRFAAQRIDGRPAVQITSRRYGAIGEQPLYQLWEFFPRQLGVSLSVRDTMPEAPLPEVPAPAAGLLAHLAAAVPEARVRSDAASRLRAGTGHGLADIWRLRTRDASRRVPDAVVRPETEEEVGAVLRAARDSGFAVIPVGGRTNVTSATACPSRDADPRPFVSMDMRGLAQVLWVNPEDGMACIEAGITGVALKDALQQHGVTMGMEPDSMEFSTLGGWISTRASGMKRARYGNIEEMVVEVRVMTAEGVLWQHNGDASAAASSCGAHGGAVGGGTAFGRASANTALSSLVLGSEGCLGVVTSAIVRVKPLPAATEHQSVVFPDWESGAAWMREVARLPAALRPTSCRLMDNKQLELSRAIREGKASHGLLRSVVQAAALRLNGINLATATAATLLFEGTREEVAVQKRVLSPLVRRAGGMWGGASSGEAGYALTFAIAYLRDLALDYRILSESMETMVPWSAISRVWPAVVSAVNHEHRKLNVPGKPFLSCRMTQLYDEGGVLYMYMAVCTGGLSPERALEAFEHLEHTARQAVLEAGGCLSHHHGVGKLRAPLLASTQAPEFTNVLRRLKSAVDPQNVLGARNGPWTHAGKLRTQRPDQQGDKMAEACVEPGALAETFVEKDSCFEPESDATAEPSLKEKYDEALNTVKTWEPSKTIPTDRRLILYGLFTQEAKGDVQESRPGMLNYEGRKKWDAWNENKGKDKETCQKEYIEELGKQVKEFS